MGEVDYCRLFHPSFEGDGKWVCHKCDISLDKKISDNFTGPK